MPAAEEAAPEASPEASPETFVKATPEAAPQASSQGPGDDLKAAPQAESKETSPTKSAGSALPGLWDACPDGRIALALPSLLKVLPQDAQQRCCLALRKAVAQELASCTLQGSEQDTAVVRSMLAPSALASPGNQKTRPFRAMAMPFAAVKAAAADSAPDKASAGEGIEADAKAREPATPSTADSAAGTEDVKGQGQGRLKRSAAERDDKKTEGERAPKALRRFDTEAAGRSIVVKNLDFNATEAHIEGLFTNVGELSEVRIARDHRTGRSRGYAVIEFSDKEAVPAALKRSGRLVRGRKIRVEEFKLRHERDAGSPPATQAAVSEEGAEAATSAKEVAGNTEDASQSVAEDSSKGKKDVKLRPEPIKFVKAGAEDPPKDVQSAEAVGSAKDEATSAEAVPTGKDGIGKPETACPEPSTSEAGKPDAATSLQEHAQQLKRQAVEALQQATKKTKGHGVSACTAEAALKAFPAGEDGLKAGAALASEHSSAEALLAAVGAEELKQRLVAIGLKSGGSPLDRAERFQRLCGVSSLAELPKELFPTMGKKQGKKDVKLRPELIKFVRAGAEEAALEPMVAD